MTIHQKFILTPLSTILRDATASLRCMRASIDVMPLMDYFMQSLFLRMTGFQEQKVKCICWELACDDYDYRYRKFSRGFDGECSSYDDKNFVLNDLFGSILLSLDPTVHDSIRIDRKEILQSAKETIVALGESLNVFGWLSREFSEAKRWYSSLNEECILKIFQPQAGQKKPVQVKLFAPCANCSNAIRKQCCLGRSASLASLYEDSVYKHRNRCAHNTTAYQNNIPKFTELYANDGLLSNYMVRFFLLLLIDEMFVRMYLLYRTCKDDLCD